jgi:phosphoribosylformylglycinamidine cyclo-ligase
MIQHPGTPLTYADAGVIVDGESEAMRGLLGWVKQSFALRQGVGKPLLGLGHFANVLELGGGKGLAVCADGVGTKILVAEMVEKYDTIGIDCVAMNVNDLVCVGAEPIAFLNYIAVQTLDAELLEQLGRGLYAGCEEAGVTIPGGETAQLREMIAGVREGQGFDLVGMALGTVDLDKVLLGSEVSPGDAVLGLASSGIHSNGLSLARKALFDRAGLRPDERVSELGRTVGEELLEPTRLYVKPALALLHSDVEVKAMAHVTGGGILNMRRYQSPFSLNLDWLPKPPTIFGLIQQAAGIGDEEMYVTFNMGVGLTAIVDSADLDKALRVVRQSGHEAWKLGQVIAEPGRQVRLKSKGLITDGERLVAE